MGNQFHMVLVEVVDHWCSGVGRCIVMQECPTLVMLGNWALAANRLVKSLHDSKVNFSIDAMPIWYKFPVHNTKTVKENNQHKLPC